MTKLLSLYHGLPSAVNSQYAHLQYLSSEWREIAHEELISRMGSLEINGDKDGTDSTKCTEAD